MKRLKGILSALLFALTLLLAVWPQTASAATKSVIIKVGYFGGPYYEKAVLTLDDLATLDEYRGTYTFLDKGGFMAYADAKGYRLTDILRLAGVDVNSINRCHFGGDDGDSVYHVSIDSKTLFGSERYAFPNLSYYYGVPPGEVSRRVTDMDAVWRSAENVPTILSVRDNYDRVFDYFGEYNPREHEYTEEKGLRLFFGQTAPNTVNANQMAQRVFRIEVEFGGAPTISVGQEQLELKVGSDYKVRVTVNSSDEVITKAILSGLKWSSSDESVVQVDSNGQLTVVGKGEAVITVHSTVYDSAQSDGYKNMKDATIRIVAGDKENISGGGDGQGDGSGTGDGSGQTDSGTGTGTGDSDSRTDGKTNTSGGAGTTGPRRQYIQSRGDLDLDKDTEKLRVGRLTMRADNDGTDASRTDADSSAQQPWRDKGMEGGSTALGLILKENPLAVFVAGASAVLVLLGGAGMYVRYRREIKR